MTEPGGHPSPSTGDAGSPLAIIAGHGSIVLIESACTSCMICARECPSWCITIDSHTEQVTDRAPGARPRTENVLDRFAIDWSLCMYCGICVEECPFDALAWSADLALPADALGTLTAELTHGRAGVSDEEPGTAPRVRS